MKAIEAFTVSNEEIGAMIAAVDLEGGKVEDEVAKWVAENEDRWSGWIK